MEAIDRQELSRSGTGLAREIHVWFASSDVGPHQLRALWFLLSAGERALAQRFCFPQDQRRFIARRGLLRGILARYLGAKAHELRFAYSPFGKPAIVPDQNRPPLDFNVSHSADHVLLAVTACGEIGIDVERIDGGFDYRNVAANFFSRQEMQELERAPLVCARRLFFRLWSLREAVGKAQGDGVAVFADGCHTAETAGEADQMWGYSTTELHVGDGYAAALALCGRWELQPQPWDGRLEGWNACYRVGLETPQSIVPRICG